MGKSMKTLVDNGKKVTTLNDLNLFLVAKTPFGVLDDAVIEWGDIKQLLQNYFDAIYEPLGVDYPKSFEAFHDAFKCSTAETKGAPATARYQTYSFQTTPANGQTWDIGFVIEAGTYTVTVLAETDASSPKLDWTLNGVSQTTGQDWYSASTILDVEKTFTLTVPSDGYHVLRATINGKNASSANYYWTHTKITITPSAY